MGNPFATESLDTKDLADPCAVERLSTHLEKGKEQFQCFFNKLNTDDSQIYQPIKKNKTDFFVAEQRKSNRSETTRLFKEDCNLFSQLFISCQSRGCDLQEFFKHENQAWPPSLSKNGNLRSCRPTKSDLTDVLQNKVRILQSKPESDVLIVDGTSPVHAVRPKVSEMFDEYAKNNFLPLIHKYSSGHRRTDVVFDVCQNNSLV